MKIHYSPYFNGHAYIDYNSRNNGMLGECVESTSGLLARLELICGLSYPESDSEEQLRRLAYYEALNAAAKETGIMVKSVANDAPETDPRRNLRVTTELLSWRDSLILAGWDRKEQLPEGKLRLLQMAEQQLEQHSLVYRGVADRWLDLEEKLPLLQQAGIEIVCYCPKGLIPARIAQLIDNLKGEWRCEYQQQEILQKEHCQVYEFEERYQAFEWLAVQPRVEGQLVVCADGERLDHVLRRFGVPIASGEKTQEMCHLVADDVRCRLDVPESLIWLDCNGDYGYRYPYGFLSLEERKALPYDILSEQTALGLVDQHIVHLLNEIKGNVVLVSSKADRGELLTEHPMVAALLYVGDEEKRLKKITPEIEVKKQAEEPEKRFESHIAYQLPKDKSMEEPLPQSAVIKQSTMSYSTLDTLINHPFDFVMERQADLKEPYHDTDLRTERGNVAHRVVQLMVDNGGITLDTFDNYLQEALKDKGDLLLQPENAFELEEFTFILHNSIGVLEGIIKEQKLTVVASEYRVPELASNEERTYVKFDVFGQSSAELDLLLKNEKGEYVIFDFKYSTSRKRYIGILETNKSVQFEFYKEIFSRHSKKYQGQVKAYGYYLFPLCTLFVPEGSPLKGNNIEEVSLGKEALTDPFVRMEKSYKFRMEQLEKGLIEEAEHMSTDDIPYCQETELFPLKSDKNLKLGPYAPCHVVLKNQIR